MFSSLGSWWKEGQAESIAVYPARLLLPLTILTALVGVLYVTLHDSKVDYWLFSAYWVACAVPLLVRRRRAAIFTTDAFLFRPVFGQPLKIPLAGIKRAYFVSRDQTGYNGPTVRLEFIVGGQIDILLRVSKTGEIIRRLEQAASE